MTAFERALRAIKQGMSIKDVRARFGFPKGQMEGAVRARADYDLAKWQALGARHDQRAFPKTTTQEEVRP